MDGNVWMRIVGEIARERARQDDKWGPERSLSPFFWLAILTEEVGEAAKAALDSDRQGLREEVIQVAAVAVAWLEAMSRKEE